MTRKELITFIQKSITEQGNSSAAALSKLANELIKHIPCVVHISSNKQEDLGKTSYTIIDEQDELNLIIDAVASSEISAICVHDGGVTLHFTHLEVSDELVICYLSTFDGTYTLTLSKEPGLSTLTHS